MSVKATETCRCGATINVESTNITVADYEVKAVLRKFREEHAECGPAAPAVSEGEDETPFQGFRGQRPEQRETWADYIPLTDEQVEKLAKLMADRPAAVSEGADDTLNLSTNHGAAVSEQEARFRDQEKSQAKHTRDVQRELELAAAEVESLRLREALQDAGELFLSINIVNSGIANPDPTSTLRYAREYADKGEKLVRSALAVSPGKGEGE